MFPSFGSPDLLPLWVNFRYLTSATAIVLFSWDYAIFSLSFPFLEQQEAVVPTDIKLLPHISTGISVCWPADSSLHKDDHLIQSF